MKFELQPAGLNLQALSRAKTPAKVEKNLEDGDKKDEGVFAKMLASADATATEADKATLDLMGGQVEIHEAMVRMEKADLMLKLGTTVRNKLLDAYQQLMSSAGQ